ncbi:hypothetical protein EGW08_009500, partial [Elysia chlorotica]
MSRSALYYAAIMDLYIVLLLCVVIYVALCWLLHLPKVTDYRLKYVVITACDSGIGRLLALRLHALGFNVFAGCATREGVYALTKGSAPRLKPILLDVTNEESLQDFLKTVKLNLPRDTGIWALVNNASILGTMTSTDLLTSEDYLKVLDMNLLGPAETIRHFLPLMRKSRGRVVNVSCVNGCLNVLFPPYSASQFGIEALSGVVRTLPMTDLNFFCLAISLAVQRLFRYFFESESSDVDNVLNAYIHAITARVSKTRYVVGWDDAVMTWSMCYLPDFIADRLV